jgi:hypothetical protein
MVLLGSLYILASLHNLLNTIIARRATISIDVRSSLMDSGTGAVIRGKSRAIIKTMTWTTKSTILLTSANIVSFLNDDVVGRWRRGYCWILRETSFI